MLRLSFVDPDARRTSQYLRHAPGAEEQQLASCTARDCLVAPV